MARTSRIFQEQTMPLSRTPLVVGLTLCFLWIASVSPVRGATKIASHPPMRPLPVALNRPMEKGPAYFVDPVKGDDASVGSQDKPWKTVTHAVHRLQAGDTLYLRGGTYYEKIALSRSGTAEA